MAKHFRELHGDKFANKQSHINRIESLQALETFPNSSARLSNPTLCLMIGLLV